MIELRPTSAAGQRGHTVARHALLGVVAVVPAVLSLPCGRGTTTALGSGVVEGFNGKAKLTTGKAFGFRTPQNIESAFFLALGRLPEPKFTHRFWLGG